MMKGYLADIKHAFRLYQRTPTSSVIAVIVLAVGLAVVGAFLSLYVDLVLRPHPGFEQSTRIVTLGQSGGPQLLGLPYSTFQRIAEEMTSIESAVAASPVNVLIGSEREPGSIEMVSSQFFNGLRPRLALGRGFRPEEHSPNAEPVAVISYRLWQRRFGGDPDALGSPIEMSRDPNTIYWDVQTFQGEQGTVHGVFPSEPEQQTTTFRIVGVMSDDLPGLTQPQTDLWVPLEQAFSLYVGVTDVLSTSFQFRPRTFVRRRAEVSAMAVMSELQRRYGAEPEGEGLVPGMRLDSIGGVVRDINVQRDVKRQLEMFLAGSVLLALVAAANTSLFLLARAPGRRRELGIRMTVGAPIRRLARQLATEAALLVMLSATTGLLFSAWLNTLIPSLPFMREAEWRDVTLIDWRVLTLAGAFVFALTLLVSLAPILGIRSIAASSRVARARASLAQRLAGTAQIAVAAALGGAALAFAWYLTSSMLGDPGYQMGDRYAAQFRLPGAYPGADSTVRLVETARRREILEAIPGVTAVGFGRPIPGLQADLFASIQIPLPDDSSNVIESQSGSIDSRFIDVLGLRLIHGRAPEDREPGVLINQTLARALWGREDVVGELLPGRVGGEIIGVLRDLAFSHPAAGVTPYVFSTSYDSLGSLVIESSLTAAALQREFDRIHEAGEIDIQVSGIRSLAAARDDQLAPDRARGILTITTATLVVALAVFGYYGTQRYLVVAGRREYAIRASVGAGPRSLGRLVVLRGLQMSFPGLVLGVLLAFIVVSWLRVDFLGGVPSPLLVTLTVAVGLILILLAATLGPAREARRTRPALLLRED